MPPCTPPSPTDPNFPHHTTTGYQYGCREQCCRQAKNDYMTIWRTKRRGGRPAANAGRNQNPAPHGTRSRYTKQRCRCPQCRQANTDYMNLWNRGIGLTDLDEYLD